MVCDELFICPREPVKNYLADFFPLRGYPPYSLSRKSFCQKTLSGNGGTPPPLNGKSPKIFLKNGSKRAKISPNDYGQPDSKMSITLKTLLKLIRKK